MMQRKILLGILIVLIIIAILFKSPFAATYNYNRAKSLYDNNNYQMSLPYFEKSFFANPNNSLNRYYYVMALSKSKPTYSVQKKLYELSQNKNNDEATKLAKSKALQMRNSILAQIGDNYIYNAASGSDIIRWDVRSFPLKVYIEESNVPKYYITNIRSALSQWINRTTFVNFSEVKNEADAQIVIRFKDIDSSACDNGTCKYIVAYTEPTISGNNTLKKMTLTFYKTNPRNEKFLPPEIYSTALHEIGHTLGIMGHSYNSNEIMYAAQGTVYKNTKLSQRDLKTLVLLYRTKPTITNTYNLSSEAFYYAPLIIGTGDVIIQKKIEEYTKYIKSYPQLSTGYINLGGAYSDAGDFEKALQCMQTAEKYAKTNDERYLIYYNKAIIYYNMKVPDKAMQYAQQAQSIKNDSSVSELIEDIKSMK